LFTSDHRGQRINIPQVAILNAVPAAELQKLFVRFSGRSVVVPLRQKLRRVFFAFNPCGSNVCRLQCNDRFRVSHPSRPSLHPCDPAAQLRLCQLRFKFVRMTQSDLPAKFIFQIEQIIL